MYLIGHKGGSIAINREITMCSIWRQMTELDETELDMVKGFIKGLKAAKKC